MSEGRLHNLADHFQTLDWMMDEIQKAKQTFEELRNRQLQRRRRTKNDKDGADDYNWLAVAAECAWQKCERYYNKADECPAYYTAMILNPTLKTQWFHDYWSTLGDKQGWIKPAIDSVKEFWLEEYKGSFSKGPTSSSAIRTAPPLKEKAFAGVRSHKRLKTHHVVESEPAEFSVDLLDEFIATDVIRLKEDEEFDVLAYWNERYHSQPDLAHMALDILAVPPMSDEIERIFSSAKLLLTDRRSRLKMDIIEANECLRSWYGRPGKREFDYCTSGQPDTESLEPEVGREDDDNGQGDEKAEEEADIQILGERFDKGEEMLNGGTVVM